MVVSFVQLSSTMSAVTLSGYLGDPESGSGIWHAANVASPG